MRLNMTILLGSLFLSQTLGADTLGFFEQKFSDLHFEKGAWSRTAELPCYSYIARADGATVDVLRIGQSRSF